MTEYLYLASLHTPSEDEQAAVYEQVAEESQGRPVVIRTLDLGADKLPYIHYYLSDHQSQKHYLLS